MDINYVYLVVGIIILIVALVDIIITTLAPSGAGPFTAVITRIIWKLLFIISGGKGNNAILNSSGILTVLIVLFLWVAMIWMGNSLIIISDPYSVLHAQTLTTATVVDKIYFTGYTLSTLGYGDFNPNTDFWKIYVAALSFSGLIILSIAISYLLPILNADIQKRRLSILITSMGNSPQAILLDAWNGSDFKALDDHFRSLAKDILLHSQNHLAYPILHYFHSANTKENAAVSLVALDEALSILYIYVPRTLRPSEYDMNVLRKAMTHYLTTLSSAFISAADESPELPDLAPLRKKNIPLEADDEKIRESYQRIAERRKLLLGLVRDDGWSWDSIQSVYYSKELTLLESEDES